MIAFIIAALILTAIITSVIMAYLGKVKKRGLKGRRLRDLRRCLLARRGVILAVGIFFAAASAVAALPLSEKQTPSLPSSGGEYLYAAESLLDYCDGLDLKPGSAAAEKVENVMRYQLSSAMAEILNNKAAINLKEVRTHYQRLAEHKDSANHTGLARAQEMRKAAEDGSALSYLDRVKDYMEQEIEAGLAGIKADYYHNLVDLMRADVAVTEGAGERARAYIDGAAEALTEILTVPPRPELPMLAALAGYAAGILISMAIVLLVSLIRLGVRRNSQNGRTESMENADIMDMISFRG